MPRIVHYWFSLLEQFAGTPLFAFSAFKEKEKEEKGKDEEKEEVN